MDIVHGIKVPRAGSTHRVITAEAKWNFYALSPASIALSEDDEKIQMFTIKVIISDSTVIAGMGERGRFFLLITS